MGRKCVGVLSGLEIRLDRRPVDPDPSSPTSCARDLACNWVCSRDDLVDHDEVDGRSRRASQEQRQDAWIVPSEYAADHVGSELDSSCEVGGRVCLVRYYLTILKWIRYLDLRNTPLA